MIIKNAKVFTDQGIFEQKDIFIKNGIITDEENAKGEDHQVIDGSNLLAVPGLIDIHFHGAVGHDFCDGDLDGLNAILRYELSSGITAACPTTMSFPPEVLFEAIDTALEAGSDRGAELVGINLEGPFIGRQKVGAQNASYVLEGDSSLLRKIIDRGQGLIKLVDVAPEIKANMKLIDEFKNETRFSLAHTEADYEMAVTAFEHGASQLTHMFNGMKDISHRMPGPELAALEKRAFVELISDGVHNHDAIIRMVFKLFDEDRIVLISDSMRATGFEDGTYSLGGQNVSVKGNECRLEEHPETIAGSNTNLFDCLKHAICLAKVPMAKAIFAATRNPARAIGIDDMHGSIRKGCYGNILLIDKEFNLKHIIKNGIEYSSLPG